MWVKTMRAFALAVLLSGFAHAQEGVQQLANGIKP